MKNAPNPWIGNILLVIMIALLGLNLFRMEFFSSTTELLTPKLSSVPEASHSSLREMSSTESVGGYAPAAKPSPSCNKAQASSTFNSVATKGKIFDELTETEMTKVVNWLLTSSGLDLIAWEEAGEFDNYIHEVSVGYPDKAEALAYLDGTGAAPVRRAKVVIHFGALTTPVIREYFVSPIPATATATGVTLTPIAYRGITDIPYDARNPDTKTYDVLEELILADTAEIEDILLDSYGTTYTGEGCTDDFQGCLLWSDTSPRGLKHEVALWFAFDVDAFYANPIGLEFVYNMGGNNPDDYALTMVIYNGQKFDSLSEFKDAYNAGTLTKIANRPLLPALIASTHGVAWSSLQKAPVANGIHDSRSATTRLNSNIPAPQVQNPGGQRFLVKDNHVEYLGWQFHVGIGRRGIKLFDVRYRGTRILYEAGLSEAHASYAGDNDVIQATTIYADSAWGLGYASNSATRGVDCPATGVLLPFSFFWDSDSAATVPDAICIFEMDTQFPVRRHLDNSNWDGTYITYGGLPGNALVVRSLMTVYNYDYVIDHIFHINGGFEIKSAISGYLQSTFWSSQFDDETTHYGTKVHDFTAGTLHDHVLSYKLDVDVGGADNTLFKTVINAESVTPKDINGNPFTLSAVETDGGWMTKKLVTTPATTEAGYLFDPAHPAYFTVVNNDLKNKWGHFKGYSVKTSGYVQNVLASQASYKFVSFTKYNLAVTLRKETEPEVSSVYDQSDPTGSIFSVDSPQPLVDLESLIDGENIEDKDLVLWAMVGNHHWPSAEDIPVTNTIGNTAHIYLLPHNMFDYDDYMDMGNAVFAPGKIPKAKPKAQPSPPEINLYDLKTDGLCPLSYNKLGDGSLQNYGG